MATYTFKVNGEEHAYRVSDAGWAFFQACAQDSELRALADGLPSVDAVAELGRSRGFGTTYDDIFEVVNVATIEHETRQRAGELTDDELDLVSGGFGISTGTTKPACKGTKCITCCSAGKSCSDCYCPSPCR